MKSYLLSDCCVVLCRFFGLSTTVKYCVSCFEITVEQYDQLQAMGKTNEEKELEESKVDQDSPEAVKARIQNMTHKGVCTAIVNLMKNDVSDRTKEQLVVCMMRMANEPSIRGQMIQHGCLSECQKVSKALKKISTLFMNGPNYRVSGRRL